MSPPGFAEVLPEAARQAFFAWRAARHEDDLPRLSDFAPHRLPRQTMPWILLQREQPDGEVVYGLIGDELLHLFPGNVKGQPVLQCAASQEQTQRMALIRRTLDTGMPFWFTGTLLFKGREQMPVGRISLPARSGRDRVVIVIYFLLDRAPGSEARTPSRTELDPRDVHWCGPGDLEPVAEVGRMPDRPC